MDAYQQFLARKRIAAVHSGFEAKTLNPHLKQFQEDVVRWSLRCGRSGQFTGCGTGKTIMQLSWAEAVIHANKAKRILILCPLAVANQTKREAEKFAISVDVKVCKEQSQVRSGITIANYERLHKFDTSQFDAVVLDESSILKGMTSTTRKTLTEAFERTPYKLACTATPAPNDYMELGNHAEFLGAMSRTEMLSMFFVHDGGETSKWRLRGHAEEEFWRWMGTWSVMIRKPSDLGYDDEGYDLPPLRFHEHVVENKQGQDGMLFAMDAKTLSERRGARKGSVDERVQVAADLANKSGEPWLMWCDYNDESKALAKAIPDSVEVTGSDSMEAKEEAMEAFTSGQIRVMVSKPSIAGWGMNWQHCCKQAFVGLSDSFEAMYQAIRRSYRFGQEKPVDVHVITSDTEGAVVANIKRKEADAENMATRMIECMADITSESVKGVTRLKTDYKETKATGNGWEMNLGDCCEGVAGLDDNSIDYSAYSLPFASLYTYSASDRDMGNSKNYDEFCEHFRFLVSQLHRVMKPGRLVSVHCMNLPTTLAHHGQIGVQDFRGDIIRTFIDDEAMEMHTAIRRLEKRIVGAFAAGEESRAMKLQETIETMRAELQAHPGSGGFVYHSEVCIWKDPVTAMQRTKALGLLHKQIVKDSTMSRQGIPDYVCTFRKPGVNEEPVSGGFDRFIGDASTFKSEGNLSIDVWQRYASPVWMDINATRTLQYMTAREENDERHICVAAGSMVLTEGGYKAIELVEVGETVLTHLGRWRKVLAKRCNGIRETVRIEAQGVHGLRVTEDHRIWTRSGVGSGRWPSSKPGVSHPKQTAMKSRPEWREAKDIKSHYVNLPLPPVEESKWNEAEWWIAGRWLGDGHWDSCERPALHISCGSHEVESLSEKLGEYAGGTYDTGTSFQIRIKDRGGRLRELIKKFGKGASEKTVPREALSLNKELAASFLDGYMSADGHYVESYDRQTASSVSRSLLLGMAMVSQRVHGLSASVYAGRKGGTCNIQGRTVNTKDDWVFSATLSPRNSHGFMAEDGAWKRVRKVEESGLAEVWDIQVEEDESFIAEGCAVHNCPLQLDVIERCIEMWSNPGDLVLSPFAGIGSEGHVALEMGRRFIGFELKESYWKHAVANLRKAEEKARQAKRTLFSMAE